MRMSYGDDSMGRHDISHWKRHWLEINASFHNYNGSIAAPLLGAA